MALTEAMGAMGTCVRVGRGVNASHGLDWTGLDCLSLLEHFKEGGYM